MIVFWLTLDISFQCAIIILYTNDIIKVWQNYKSSLQEISPLRTFSFSLSGFNLLFNPLILMVLLTCWVQIQRLSTS